MKPIKPLKRLLPGRTELCILLGLAIIAAALVGLAPETDLATAGLSVPLFIAAALMGLRRSPQFTRPRTKAPELHETTIER